jgi:hypothetical protein
MKDVAEAIGYRLWAVEYRIIVLKAKISLSHELPEFHEKCSASPKPIALSICSMFFALCSKPSQYSHLSLPNVMGLG